ncbi:MAG TPA: fibronectin type III domain-containing protein, partial [Gemmatimonadaceae bacterium]|nr:fibronectin type III domain-containing protein [Gemmatimonadaceae bacterium]
GEFTKNAYDGVYSPRSDAGALVPTGIRYDSTAVLAMTTPVRIRETEPAEDLRDFLEKHIYTPHGYAPALDSEGRVSPVSQIPPSSMAGLPEITATIAEPRPSWGAGARVINVLRFTYWRDYVPSGSEETTGDGLAAREIKLEYRNEDSITRHGEQVLEIDGRAFRAIGQPDSEPLDDDITAETGHVVAELRDQHVRNRYLNGAPAFGMAVMRSGTPAVRAGSFVSVTLPWLPSLITGRRGLATVLAQVMALGELDCAWREVLLELVPPPPPPPAAITDLTATAVSPTAIDLAWTLPSGATGVRIYRGLATGFTVDETSLIDTVGAVASYADTGLTDETDYFYRVVAFNEYGDAAASNEATDETLAIPSPPDLLTATRTEIEDGDLCAAHTWRHSIAWTTSGSDDVNFEVRIWRATNLAGDNWSVLINGLTTASSSYTDDTEISGNIGGVTAPETAYRKYRVQIRRKSDGASIEQLDTTQGSITYYTDPCA